VNKERDEYEKFAAWLLDAAQQRLLPDRFDPYVLFEVWKAAIRSVQLPETTRP
jgi:hypothetical protein